MILSISQLSDIHRRYKRRANRVAELYKENGNPDYRSKKERFKAVSMAAKMAIDGIDAQYRYQNLMTYLEILAKQAEDGRPPERIVKDLVEVVRFL